MPTIATFVFFDIETTGLPWQERNQTKITDCSFIAASRNTLEATSYGQIPLVSKFSVVLNPERPIHPTVTNMTGLSNELLQHAPVFRRRVKSLTMFLEELTKPVCLVAHNGNAFDFKILLAECNDAGVCLPEDLLCVDSLVGFRALLKNSNLTHRDLENIREVSLEAKATNQSNQAKNEEITSDDDLLTDDEDEWSDLNVTNEELKEIDDICSSVSDFDEPVCKPENAQRSKAIRNVFVKETATNNFKLTTLNKRLDDEDEWSDLNLTNEELKEIDDVCSSVSDFDEPVCKPKNIQRSKAIHNVFVKKTATNNFKLTTLYKRLLNKEEMNAHRAEVDCLMLAECVVAMKQDFLVWADNNCKLLTKVKPLVRY